MKKTPSRQVKHRAANINLTKPNAYKNRKPAQALKKVPGQVRKTKTRRYLLYGLGCFVLVQVLKFIVDSFIFTSPDTPGGFGFLLFIYAQIGLMLATLGFIIAASISYLQRLNKQT